MSTVPKDVGEVEDEGNESHVIRNEDKPEGAQEDRSYYYDDAHGYEDFDPDEREDEED